MTTDFDYIMVLDGSNAIAILGAMLVVWLTSAVMYFSKNSIPAILDSREILKYEQVNKNQNKKTSLCVDINS